MQNINWEKKLEQINKGIEEERKLLKKQLRQKIEEYRNFKIEVNGQKDTNLQISKAREDRIRQIEKKNQELSQQIAQERGRNHSLEESIRIARIRAEGLDRENRNLRQELQNSVKAINQLRLQLLPQTGRSQASRKHRRLDRLEESISHTQHFYREMTEKIDRILRY